MARCLKAGIKTPLIRYVDVNRYCIIMDYRRMHLSRLHKQEALQIGYVHPLTCDE